MREVGERVAKGLSGRVYVLNKIVIFCVVYFSDVFILISLKTNLFLLGSNLYKFLLIILNLLFYLVLILTNALLFLRRLNNKRKGLEALISPQIKKLINQSSVLVFLFSTEDPSAKNL